MGKIYIGTEIFKGGYISTEKIKKIYVDTTIVWQSAIPIARPTSAQLNPSGTYTGSAISNGFSIAGVEYIRGDESGINAGVYIAYYRPDSEHIWEDTEDREEVACTLTINPATGYISLSTVSTTCVSGESNSFSVTSSHGGTISSSSSSGCIGTSASGNTISIWGGTGDSGATITVTCAATQNYTAASATCYVSLYFRLSYTYEDGWGGAVTTDNLYGAGYLLYNGNAYYGNGTSITVPYGATVYVYGKALQDNVYHEKDTCTAHCYIDGSRTGWSSDYNNIVQLGSYYATHNMTVYIWNKDYSTSRNSSYGTIVVYMQY